MDIIFINGKIYTMDKSDKISEAIGVKDNKIIKVGSTEELLALKEEGNLVVDLEGKTVVPGFNDSHMHLLNCGYTLTQAALGGTESIEEINNAVRSFIKEKDVPNGTWVRGRGWNHDYFTGDKVFPTRYDLDKISKDHPIVVTRTCGHVAVTNSKALEVLGIKKGSPQVVGGHFDLDEDGEPLGIFRENALWLVYNAIPDPDVEEIKDMISSAAKKLNESGITSVGSDDFEALPGKDYEKVIQAYLELRDEGKLTVRVYEQCLIPEMDKLQGFFEKGYKTGWGDELFKIGPLKLLIDGSLGARTAALNEPYTDDPDETGILTATQEELDELVDLSQENDTHVAIHGIGDKAMYMSFEAIEKALEKNHKEDHRHGIVHCQITDEYLLNKFAELNAIAYIQPIFLDYDWKIVEDRIGKDRLKNSYNWKTMVDRGIPIACGSDAPVETFSVMAGIYEAVTRKDLEGNPAGGWLPEQALSVKEALYGYTMGGAYASFEEDIKGSLEVGKLADMVVLSEDIFEIDPDRIKDVKVEQVVFNGKLML